jgi:glycosyltransferase involved in cell wall biosynthesis
MLARRPVIATAAGGAAEIISHGHDGVLVPPGSPKLLAAAIADLLANPGKAREMAERGYETALSEFSLNTFLNGVDQVASEAAGKIASQPRMPLLTKAVAS